MARRIEIDSRELGRLYLEEKLTSCEVASRMTVREIEKERVDCFSRSGYGCLVIWQHELTDPGLVKGKIEEFSLTS